MTPEDRKFLKEIYKRLGDNPLEPGDALYQPVYQAPGLEDPIELLQRHIEYTDVESLQMFSGFRGSGKTTELFRLRKNLEDAGYLVLYSDALDYVNPSEEIDISDLLIVLAGAFSDALDDVLKVDIAHESYWTRLKNYLNKTDVDITEAGVKTGVELKLALKTTPSFRQNLQRVLSNRIGELRQNVVSFFEDGVKAVRTEQGEDKQIVFIFDSLEQIRGSLSNEQTVIRSVERLFANHLKLLALPYIHAVYTVPPWLQFVMPNAVDVYMLPSVCQWHNDPPRSKKPAGCDALNELVRKRFGNDGFVRFFGGDFVSACETAGKLIDVCGGHFRDLLLLLREAALRAKTLPVSQDVLDSAIKSVRTNFLPIAIEDALWLARIEEQRTTALPSVSPEDVSRLTRFLDTHFVLYLKNGDEWYDIHPLIRDEVAEIVKRQQEVKAKTPANS